MTTLINNQKSTVLQLPSYSRLKNVNKVSNAEWSVSIATQNIAINEGDNVVVKNVFLDTRNIGSSIISIPQDFEIEMDFFFYIMMNPSMYSNASYTFQAGTLQQYQGVGATPTVYGNNMTIDSTNQPIGIELPLVLQFYNKETQKQQLVSHKFKKIFPKGNYSPSEMALTLNKLFSKLPDTLLTSQPYSQGVISDITSGVAFLNYGVGSLAPDNINTFGYSDYNPTTKQNDTLLITTFFGEFLKDKEFPNNYNTLGTSFENPLCINQFQVGELGALQLGDAVGSNQMSIIFDPNANIFKFDYTHFPIQVPIDRVVNGTNNSNSTVLFGAPVESVLLCATLNNGGDVNMCKYSKHSGIIFNNLQPASFFGDILGFDLKNLLVSSDDILNRTITFEKFNNITTDGLTSTNMLFDSSTPHFEPSPLTYPLNSYLYQNLTAPPLPTGGTAPYVSGGSGTYSNGVIPQMLLSPSSEPLPFYQYPFSSIGTRTISAIKPPTSELETGHYLIQIDGYMSEFISPNQVMNIKAIVSSYYQSQSSFVTAPFSDSYSYVHTSPVPLVLSNLKIRVLNPITLEPVTGLGPNNAVYLQINRSIQGSQVG